jgi:hypothetical protein
MRTHTKLLSATLGAAVLAMVGCSDGDTTLKDANSTNSIFGDDAVAVDKTAWEMPREGLFFYDMAGSMTTDWQTTVATATDAGAKTTVVGRPGAEKHDFTVDATSSGYSETDVGYIPYAFSNSNEGNDQNFGVTKRYEIEYGAANADASHEDVAYFAKDEDGATYMTSGDGGEWSRVLPKSTSKNTSWLTEHDDAQSVLGISSDITMGYAYKTETGTFYHSPYVKVDNNGDPQNTSGADATKLSDYAIGYETASTVYKVKSIKSSDVRALGYNTITDTNVEVTVTDDAGTVQTYKGCIEITTTYAFRPLDEDYAEDGYTVAGLDQATGSKIWYWKKGYGTVKMTATQTYAHIGYTTPNNDRNSTDGTGFDNEGSLTAYNDAYDAAKYVQYSDVVNTFPSSKAFDQGYKAGYGDGYLDVEYRVDMKIQRLGMMDYANENSDSRDSGATTAKREAFLAGYNAGYTKGSGRYDADYTAAAAPAGAVAPTYTNSIMAITTVYAADTLVGTNRVSQDNIQSDEALATVPDAYQARNFWGNYLDGNSGWLRISASEDSYPAGYNGLGLPVTLYDNSVTVLSNTSNSGESPTSAWEDHRKPLKESDEEDKVRSLALPVLSAKITRSMTKEQVSNPTANNG